MFRYLSVPGLILKSFTYTCYNEYNLQFSGYQFTYVCTKSQYLCTVRKH